MDFTVKPEPFIQIRVNNLPEETRGYIVCSVIDNELWYYGCYQEEERAKEVAYEIQGVYGWN